MLNNGIGIDGVHAQNNSTAESCFAGTFEVTRFRSNGGNLTKTFKSSNGRVSFRNGDGSNPINSISVANTTPNSDFCIFTLTYFNTRGNVVDKETIGADEKPRLYAGRERLINGRAVRSVEVKQTFVSPDGMTSLDVGVTETNIELIPSPRLPKGYYP